MRKFLDKKLNLLETEQLREVQLVDQIATDKERLTHVEKALLIMQKAAKLSQDHLAAHLSGIVTQGIQAVIGKPYEFVCEFVERRGSTEADLYLMKGGEKFDILGGTGGGLADVCSFSLKVAYLLLSNVDRVLILDEPSRHINSPLQRENFAKVMAKLSEEFKVQMIVNSTIPELAAVADQVFELEYVNDRTIIK